MSLLNRRAIAAVAAALIVSACTSEGGRINLTGRDLCWPNDQPRLATLMRGELDLGVYPWYLNTPEGEDFQIDFAGLSLNSAGDAVVDSNGNSIGHDGEMVTIFGGLDAAGIILVCAIDERHPA